MLLFIGNTEAKADAKGRIFIPASYRKQLAASGSGVLIMRKDPDSNCLMLYPQEVWTAKLEDLKSHLNEWDAGDQILLMQFVSEAEILEPDAQGRVLIPRKYLAMAGIESDALFVGGIDRFALWSPKEFERAKYEAKDFAARLAGKFKGKD
ncbi:MAG: division/cell wall cluster transcriptional repressor MraZ [Paludibacteraceae bacterium]|nr:division/cell wall cluster transcriptional repressor MraZ [Paludibacteraceae bacterium]